MAPPAAAPALAALEDTHSRDVDLAADEAAARSAAQPAAAPAPTDGQGVGTDPTGVQPQPMAGLERTGGRRISTTPGTRGQRVRQRAPEPTESRSLTVVLLVALAVVALVAAGLWWMTK
jgi:cobalamin biosynthesis Mg chelatase CobN